ncbi:DHS-like NAD/FAD-binding domain-containing protein, partial [Diaporthe sp. PMI_573]
MERTNTSRRSKPQVCEEIQVSTDGASGLKRARVAEKSPETVGKGAPSSKRRTVTEHKLENVEKHLPAILQGKKKIVVIVGAGISTSAGIPDFRSKDGLFRTLKKGGGGRHLFDASVYNDPQTTREFHEMVRKMSQLVKQVKPTPFHDMVAELAREGRLLRLYTQNIDGLETRLEFLATNLPLEPKSPWPVTIPLHGGLDQIRCTICSHIDVLNALIFQGSDRPSCPKCEETEKNRRQEGKRSRGIGYLRPRMVLYDEDNPDADAIGKVSKADLARIPDAVIVAGTSLQVPGTIRIAKEMCKATRSIDGITVWLNKEPPPSALRDLWDLELLCECDDSVAPLDLP